MTLEYACIAPHGVDLIPQLANRSTEKKFFETRRGMEELARQIAAARPDTIVIASPHNLRLLGRIGIVLAENSTGILAASHGRSVKLSARCDKEFALEILRRAEARGLPVVGVNYGTSEGRFSDMPMDWGTLVPLWFPFSKRKFNSKIVIVTPSREVPLAQNFEFGRVIAKLAEDRKRRRIVFIASADQAHSHSRKGPYGFSRAASQYDRLVCKAITDDRLASLLSIEPGLVVSAKPDSLWQMTMLAGISDMVEMKPILVSYQVPTYYGMVCADFQRIL